MIPRPVRRSARLVVGLALIGLLAACSASGAGSTTAPSAAPSAAASAHVDGYDPANCPTSQPEALGAGETRIVSIATNLGTMELTIEADLSPIAAGNFVALAECGYYDGVVFHRVVPGFVIQAGDGEFGRAPNVGPQVGTGGPGYTIKDEPVTATYGRGTVAMARTSQPDSVGSQFFIVTDDGARGALESYNTYQIIGTVTSGMEVADAITEAAEGVEIPTNPVPMADVSVRTP